MIKVGLAGGRGYVGEELLTLLAKIPEYQVVYVGSRSSAGKPVNEEYEGLDLNLKFQDLSTGSINACEADVWVIAQPNGKAPTFVDSLEDTSCKIIDISSDFRFDDEWTYGLPELNREKIKCSSRIANPGCYATATQLALLPLRDRLHGPTVAFGVSGFSGAGRTPSEKNNPQRLAENLMPYALAGHTHELEVSRHMNHDVRFMPHVAQFFRGISVTVHVQLIEPIDMDVLKSMFDNYYSDCSLVNATDVIPELRQVANTNHAIVGGFAIDERDRRQVAIVSVIDNLRKGAASQAIQNMNLMFGMNSEQGLLE